MKKNILIFCAALVILNLTGCGHFDRKDLGTAQLESPDIEVIVHNTPVIEKVKKRVRSDLVGGRQTEPLFIQLNNSGLVFRVEPMLDFSGVKTINDFSHNEVEVRITPSIEDYFLRTTYKGDVYSSEFLLKHDKLIRFVLSQ
jgi:hypothetical protein